MVFARGARSQAHREMPQRENSTSRARRLSGVFIIFTALALIAGLVVVAVSAEGRELSRTTSNDGGAWIVNRGLSSVAHRNHATGELSSHVRVTDSPTADVFQAGDLVVVHDASSNQLFEVDTRSFVEDLEPTELPEFSTVVATDTALVITRSEPLAVWRIEPGQLPGVQRLDEIQPLVSSTASGRVAAAPDGRIVVIDSESGQVSWVSADGLVTAGPVLELDSDVVDVTIVEGSAAVLTNDGDVFVVGAVDVEHVLRWSEQTATTDEPAWLQQSSTSANSSALRAAVSVALVTVNGEMIEIGLGSEQPTTTNLGSMAGSEPVPPIVHDGCTYALTTSPPSFAAACDDFQSQPLVNAGPNLRLRLVNGWVWVNDVDSGTAYATTDDLLFEEFDDWSPVEEVLNEDEPEEADAPAPAQGDADASVIEDPDAVGPVQGSDEFDPSEQNVPPVAVDDIARTRSDRALVVPVLNNDSDANNDILVVTSAELISGQARVNVTPNGEAVQVTPNAGVVGSIQLRYSISDGKSDPVSALVTIDVLGVESTNQPPVAVTDVIATAPGHSTTVDVLRNDSDPDGDAFALTSIETETGTLRWDPIGQVTFTPDNTTQAGWIELPYVITDDFGLEAEGLLRVEIRDDGANQEPDARNDQATTIVGRAVVINLLANDSDPDGDPLIVGSQPRLLEPADAVVQTSTTSDGEFVFRSEVPGTFIFSYTVNDAAESGSESDTARIRVDVLPAEQNQPPVAVRDDVVIAIGETRSVDVLANDGDPDGDLVSIVDWRASPGLQVSEFNDGTGHVGFQITVEPGLTGQPSLTYRISDGVNDPVAAPVVIAVVQRTETDQPPFANDDVIEARAGSTITGIDVLANDFDPEAGPLRIVRVGDADSAVVSIGEDNQTIDLDISADTISSFSIPYDIEDLAGNRAGAVVRVQLINADAPNRPPVARTDEARTELGRGVLIDVLSNDSDPDADIIALEAINAQPTNGVAEITDQGLVQYRPDDGFSGTDVLRYSIVDAQGDRAIGDVFIGVQEEAAANLAPIANDDSFTLVGVPSTTPLDVTANDFDPEGDPLRVVEVISPSLGAVVIDGFGRVEFQPPASLAEPSVATFDYVIVDAVGNQARASVSIELDAYDALVEPAPEVDEPEIEPTPEPEVEPTPDPTPEPTPTPDPETEENVPPIAVNDERGPVAAGSRVEISVLENDRDPDGEPGELTVTSVTGGGQVIGDNVVITVGDENVSLSYTIEDVDGAEASATITVVVIENQGPTVTALEVATAFETAIDIDVSGQAVDPDADDLFFVCCEDIRGGAVSAVNTGANSFTLTFTPDDTFIGQGGFNYRVDDQQGHQVSGSVIVDVADPGNRAPETIADTVQIPQGVTATVDLAALTSDPDDDQLTYVLTSSPGSGVSAQIAGSTASVTVDRNVAIGAAGEFTYDVTDGALTTSGTVVIDIVEGENRAPVTTDSSIDVPAAGSASIDLATLTTELDPGDFASYELGPGTTPDSISVSLEGPIMQIAATGSAIGLSTPVTFIATDTRGESAEGVVTVTVVDPTSPPPSTSPDTASTERNAAAIAVDVLANDSDPLGEGLTLVEVDSQWGTALIASNELRFAPGDRVGTSIVTYTMRDESNRFATGTATIDTVGAPDQVSPPEVTRGSAEVTITWDEPASNGSDIEGYRIFSSESEIPEVVGRQNSFTWTGLTNGTEYTFTVVAFNAVGDSIESDASPAVTPDALPEVPSPPTATRGNGELEVEWAQPTNLGTDIDRYELQIGPSSVPPVTISGGRLDHTWEGLINGDFYTFTVRAHNDAGWTDWSAPSEEQRPAAPPSQLTIGTTTRGTQGGALTVNWSNNDIGGAPILEYEVRSSAITDPVPESDPTVRSYDWSNLPTGVDMTFGVRARNEAGWSTWSAESNTIQACGVPGEPSNVNAVRGDEQVLVTWTAPADSQDCLVQNYIVQAVQSGAVVATQNSASISHTFTGLTNGEPYSFQIVASNVIGTGATSSLSQQVTPAGPPICSSNASFTAGPQGKEDIRISWSNLAADNGEPITDYEVDAGAGYVSTGLVSTQLIEDLIEDTRYDFDIRAVNVVGVSARCASASGTTHAPPSDVTLTWEFDSATDVITVTTAGGISDGVPIPRWAIDVRPLGQIGLVTPIDNGDGNLGTRTASTQITADDTYQVWAQACNIAGCSTPDPFEIAEITLSAPPEVMTASELTLTSQLFDDVYAPRPGLAVMIDMSPPEDNGSPITRYETQALWTGSSGTYHDIFSNTSNPVGTDLANLLPMVSRISDVQSDPTQFVSLGEVFRAPGYARNRAIVGGTPFTWLTRSRATNAKGAAEWSDWVEMTVPLPEPTIDFTIISATDCSPDASNQRQCHTLSVDMYGFQAGQVFDFNALGDPAGLGTLHQSGIGITPRVTDSCSASAPVTVTSERVVAGQIIVCESRLGANIRLETPGISVPVGAGGGPVQYEFFSSPTYQGVARS